MLTGASSAGDSGSIALTTGTGGIDHGKGGDISLLVGLSTSTEKGLGGSIKILAGSSSSSAGGGTVMISSVSSHSGDGDTSNISGGNSTYVNLYPDTI